MQLILYSKPGCHLCEGLQEKLVQIQNTSKNISFELEIRDITTCEDWFAAYQYEIPVLYCQKNTDVEELTLIPRPSPRANIQQLEKILLKFC